MLRRTDSAAHGTTAIAFDLVALRERQRKMTDAELRRQPLQVQTVRELGQAIGDVRDLQGQTRLHNYDVISTRFPSLSITTAS